MQPRITLWAASWFDGHFRLLFPSGRILPDGELTDDGLLSWSRHWRLSASRSMTRAWLQSVMSTYHPRVNLQRAALRTHGTPPASRAGANRDGGTASDAVYRVGDGKDLIAPGDERHSAGESVRSAVRGLERVIGRQDDP